MHNYNLCLPIFMKKTRTHQTMYPSIIIINFEYMIFFGFSYTKQCIKYKLSVFRKMYLKYTIIMSVKIIVYVYYLTLYNTNYT